MYTLYIGKSQSKNYPLASKIAFQLGGRLKGDAIVLEFEEPLTAYSKMFPLFRLRVFSWKKTRATLNGMPVHPYRALLHHHFKRFDHLQSVLNQIDNSVLDKAFRYIKREGNTFYFKNGMLTFDVTLKGKQLYEFLEEFEVGDIVLFK